MPVISKTEAIQRLATGQRLKIKFEPIGDGQARTLTVNRCDVLNTLAFVEAHESGLPAQKQDYGMFVPFADASSYGRLFLPTRPEIRLSLANLVESRMAGHSTVHTRAVLKDLELQRRKSALETLRQSRRRQFLRKRRSQAES